MKKSELIADIERQIEATQKEYDEQRESTKHFRTPGNPYIVGLGTKLGCLKSFKAQLEELDE